MFAPNQFKKSTFELDLHPVYLPFWTFDMNCYTRYSARRGDYVYVTVTKVDRDGNRYTDREREIRWSFRTGHCTNKFDDVLVLGSKNHTNRAHINKICNFDFNNLEKFNPKFLIGYAGEKISLPLEEGFKQAKENVQLEIERSIKWQVGGDEVRILTCDTDYTDVTFKQILVPIYNGIYNYRGKQYSFAMNGQNSKVAGGYPVSGIKVFFFVLSIVVILLAFILFVTSIA